MLDTLLANPTGPIIMAALGGVAAIWVSVQAARMQRQKDGSRMEIQDYLAYEPHIWLGNKVLKWIRRDK